MTGTPAHLSGSAVASTGSAASPPGGGATSTAGANGVVTAGEPSG